MSPSPASLRSVRLLVSGYAHESIPLLSVVIVPHPGHNWRSSLTNPRRQRRLSDGGSQFVATAADGAFVVGSSCEVSISGGRRRWRPTGGSSDAITDRRLHLSRADRRISLARSTSHLRPTDWLSDSVQSRAVRFFDGTLTVKLRQRHRRANGQTPGIEFGAF